MKYELISYDVWGNDDDGYEVNQSYYTGQTVILDPDLYDDQITDLLIIQGLIYESSRGRITYDGDAEYSLYAECNDTGKPLFELRRS